MRLHGCGYLTCHGPEPCSRISRTGARWPFLLAILPWLGLTPAFPADEPLDQPGPGTQTVNVLVINFEPVLKLCAD